MKSLQSIINKLSPSEIEAFRLFLCSHGRNAKNKKLKLFDQLVDGSGDTQAGKANENSRQSAYQLKKRLQEELYSFLVSQEQTKNCNDQLFMEMDCHKKLYCFKMLFDKGIDDHAYQMLNDVLEVSSKNSLHSLYLEAVNLKNTYFPLAQTTLTKKNPINHQIKKLKKSLSWNFYINRYLSESKNSLPDSDACFRVKLNSDLVDFDLTGNEVVIDRLIEVNKLLGQQDFETAYNHLLELTEKDFDISGEPAMQGLVYIELVKASICMNDLEQAKKWISRAELILNKTEMFLHVLLELQFVISLRSGNTTAVKAILEQTKRISELNESEVLMAKWSFYSLFVSFQQREFKNVIKAANGNPIFLLKSKSWLIHVKMLEILSIYQLDDFDWFYYKIESFRKTVSGMETKTHRLGLLVSLLKAHLSDKRTGSLSSDDAISKIEKQFPWHPLSNELVNYCTYTKIILNTERSVLVASDQQHLEVFN